MCNLDLTGSSRLPPKPDCTGLPPTSHEPSALANRLALCTFSLFANVTVVPWSLPDSLAASHNYSLVYRPSELLLTQVRHVICLEPHPAQALEGICYCSINVSIL